MNRTSGRHYSSRVDGDFGAREKGGSTSQQRECMTVERSKREDKKPAQIVSWFQEDDWTGN